MSNMVEVTEQTFDVGKIAATINLGAFAKGRLELRTENTIHGFLVSAFTDILEHKLVEDKYRVTFNYKVPSSWWQHLKTEKAPKWFTNKYPVRYENRAVKRLVNITRKATYPMADVVVPKNFGRVVIRDTVNPLAFWDDEEQL